jgi:Spy/CpxP family protein refolding chaperone
MRAIAAALFVGGLLAVASLGSAQPPEGGQKEGPKGGKGDKGGFGGKGGKGGFGKGGFGKGGGFGGPPAFGQILAPFVQDQLKLTDAQKKDLDAMQKDVDAKLDKILTEEQRTRLKQMKERGPGGRGGFGPGGPGGQGGPGGGNPPPKKD